MIALEIIKLNVDCYLQSVLDAVNDLLVKGQLLKIWKTSRLVLIEKERRGRRNAV